MKKLFIVLMLTITSLALHAGEGILEFESDTIDLGTVHVNTRVDIVFKFKNTGKEPIKIINVKPG